MVLGVVSPPDGENNSGNICICRVSKDKTYERMVHNQQFLASRPAEEALKASSNGWRDRVSTDDLDLTLDDIRNILWRHYDLDPEISSRLVLTYRSYTRSLRTNRTNTTEKLFYFTDAQIKLRQILDTDIITSQDEPTRKLQLKDLTVKVEYRQGDTIQEDTSCDSEYMKKTLLEKVGPAMRAHFLYLEEGRSLGLPPVKLWLQMDNAGGHGSNEAIEYYTRKMLEDFNIVIEFQPPRSPELNLLDLGLWMSMQSRVELYLTRTERQSSPEAIWKACEKVFSEFDASTISAVNKRLEDKVWDLILEENGDNTRVEERRGELTSDPRTNDD